VFLCRGLAPACPCPHITQSRPFLPLQELQPLHSANISKTWLSQQIMLTRQRGSCEEKCLCFYFSLLQSRFCNCNCTNRVSHLFPPEAQGLKTGQDSAHISSLGMGFPLHQGPSASLWQPTKGLERIEKCPLPASLARESSLAQTGLTEGLSLPQEPLLHGESQGEELWSLSKQRYKFQNILWKGKCQHQPEKGFEVIRQFHLKPARVLWPPPLFFFLV